MTRDQRSPIIELPLSITLTDEGEYFFNQNNRILEHLKGRSSGDPSKIVLSTYSAKILQRLIYAGYISQIEIARTNFNSKRGEIMDLAKLISYGVLRKDYSVKLAEALKQTPLVSQWNRKNPTKTLNLRTIVQSNPTKQHLPGQEALQTVMRAIIEKTFSHYRETIQDLSFEENRMLQYKAENFLEQLNPLIWALAAKERNTPVFDQTIEGFREVLWGYLQKTNIADYLSLLILELASMAEKCLMQKAVTTYLQGKVDLKHFMRNERDRTRVLESLKAHNDTASLIWRLQGKHSTITDSKPFHFVVSNHTAEAESILESLEGKKHLATEGKSLVEFYEEQGGEEQELGLFYLTYLQEECRKQGTLFNSYASQIRQQALSLMTLSVRF